MKQGALFLSVSLIILSIPLSAQPAVPLYALGDPDSPEELLIPVKKKDPRQILLDQSGGASQIQFEIKEAGAQGRFSWSQKEKFQMLAALNFTPEGRTDADTETALLKGLNFQPSFRLKVVPLNLDFMLKGKLSPGFSHNSLQRGNYTLANSLEYSINLDLIDLIQPVKRNYSTSFFLKGNFSRDAGFSDNMEVRALRYNATKLGFNYKSSSLLDFNIGLLLQNSETIDLTLPQPHEENRSRLNLNMDVGIQLERVHLRLEFSPMLNKTGRQQGIIRNLLTLSADFKL